MKHLKRFNEELTPYKYKKAAKKLREIGHNKRADKLEDWSVKRQEQIDKEKSDRALAVWKEQMPIYSKYGKFKWVYGKPRRERVGVKGIYSVVGINEQIVDDFYFLTYLNFEEVDNSVYEIKQWKERGGEGIFTSYIQLEFFLLPTNEETAKKMADLKQIGTWTGGMFGGWISFKLEFKEDSVSVEKMIIWDDEGENNNICKIHDRASAGKLKNLIIDILSGKSDYPTADRQYANLHDQFEAEVCNQSGLSSDFGLDMDQFVKAVKNTNTNSLFREF